MTWITLPVVFYSHDSNCWRLLFTTGTRVPIPVDNVQPCGNNLCLEDLTIKPNQTKGSKRKGPLFCPHCTDGWTKGSHTHSSSHQLRVYCNPFVRSLAHSKIKANRLSCIGCKRAPGSGAITRKPPSSAWTHKDRCWNLAKTTWLSSFTWKGAPFDILRPTFLKAVMQTLAHMSLNNMETCTIKTSKASNISTRWTLLCKDVCRNGPIDFWYQCPLSHGFCLDISTERCTFLQKLLLLSTSVWLSGNPRSKYWQFCAI